MKTVSGVAGWILALLLRQGWTKALDFDKPSSGYYHRMFRDRNECGAPRWVQFEDVLRYENL